MDDRTKQFRVGVVVFATGIITMLLILMNSDMAWSPFRKHYQLQLLVDQAPGVSAETPVRRRGILIGRVDRLEVTEEGVLITMNIEEGMEIKSNEVARIKTSLIGDAVIEFSPAPPMQRRAAEPRSMEPGAGDSGALHPISMQTENGVPRVVEPRVADPRFVEPRVVRPGDPPLRGIYVPSPLDLMANMQGDLRQTILSLGRAGDEVAVLAERVNQVLGDADSEKLRNVFESADVALSNFSKVMEDLDHILGDAEFREQLKDGLAQLPAAITDAREMIRVLEGTFASADMNLQNLQGFTGPLGERGPVIVGRLEDAVNDLSRLFEQAALLTQSINTSEGTFGLLIRDRALYDQLGTTIQQATAAVQDVRIFINDAELRRRIRQIMDNIWVFSDKVARDPARVARGIVPHNREMPMK